MSLLQQREWIAVFTELAEPRQGTRRDTLLTYQKCPRPGSDYDNNIHALHVHCGPGELMKEPEIACGSSCKWQTISSPSPTAAAIVSHPLYAIALLGVADHSTDHDTNANSNHGLDSSCKFVPASIAALRD